MAVVTHIAADTTWRATINLTFHTNHSAAHTVEVDRLKHWIAATSAVNISKIWWQGAGIGGIHSVDFAWDAQVDVSFFKIFHTASGSYGGTDSRPALKMIENGQSTAALTAAINNSVTAIPVTERKYFEVGNTIKIGSELMLVTATGTGAGNLTATRARGSTSAAAHADEAVVELSRPAGYTGDIIITPSAAYNGMIILDLHKYQTPWGAGWTGTDA